MTHRATACLAAALSLACLAPATAATAGATEKKGAPPPSLAVFAFTLDNTSPADSTREELARTRRLGDTFAQALRQSGRYTLVDMAREQALLAGQPDIRTCNGCERAAAEKLGASLAAYGWVQKVSNLILNLNVVVEDVQTGRTVTGGSVDIRGNTDESWDRGLKFLIEEHVLPQ